MHLAERVDELVEAGVPEPEARRDSTLLGAVTLEALGVILDPIRRELRPLPMVLGGPLRPA